MRPHVQSITATDGVTLSYLVYDGDGPSVMVLHGLAGSGREFAATAAALEGCRVIVPDQRGHGASARQPTDVSRAAFVADVVAIAVAEGVESLVLIGQSLGAHTAMLVAARHPELVSRLVLLECNAGGTTADEAAALGDFFRSWPVPFADLAAARAALGEGALADAWIADLEHTDAGLVPRFDADTMQAALAELEHEHWEDWNAVQCPTLVVYGEHGMFDEAQRAAFVERGANVKRVDLVGASHDAHLDASAAWIAAIRPFVTAA